MIARLVNGNRFLPSYGHQLCPLAAIFSPHSGLVLGLEVSRLARNNADWYRLLDLCGVTDTVIGDADGIYHRRSSRAIARS